MSLKQAMTAGDFIEVTPTPENVGTPKDFGVIRGTTLTTMGTIGYATFEVQVEVGGQTIVIGLNCNFVDVKVLFDAKVARSHE